MIPKESRHVFHYPTLYLTLSLSDLEDGKCNLGIRDSLFRWQTPNDHRKAVTALEANDYLSSSSEISWLEKLQHELKSRGHLRENTSLKEKFVTWAVTMPNFIGLHGINPLTVYYVYRKKENGERGSLWLCLLEVHNTFSERHLYILPAGIGEDYIPTKETEGGDPLHKVESWEVLDKEENSSEFTSSQAGGDGLSWPVDSRRTGYDHQWTFPRSFHVSPFNDRSGYYRLYLKDLWRESPSGLPTMDIRLLLLVPQQGQTGESGTPYPKLEKKLLATLASHPHQSASRPRPMTAGNLMQALLRQPFDLTLTFARIAYQAAKLHYGKKMNVFGKPELSVLKRNSSNSSSGTVLRPPSHFDGIGWPTSTNATQTELEQSDQTKDENLARNGSLHCSAPTASEQYFHAWFRELVSLSPRISVKLKFANGTDELIASQSRSDTSPCLVIYLVSYAFFTDLALYGTPSIAFLLGSQVGRRWGINNLDLYDDFFNELFQSVQLDSQFTKYTRWIDSIREKHLKWAQSFVSSSNDTLHANTPPLNRIPTSKSSTWTYYKNLNTMHITSVLEYRIFNWVGAKYVPGDEPWLEWKRGVDLVRSR
ncbi:unnamed protein product [Sympodiomycopsis kandeliae]